MHGISEIVRAVAKLSENRLRGRGYGFAPACRFLLPSSLLHLADRLADRLGRYARSRRICSYPYRDRRDFAHHPLRPPPCLIVSETPFRAARHSIAPAAPTQRTQHGPLSAAAPRT